MSTRHLSFTLLAALSLTSCRSLAVAPSPTEISRPLAVAEGAARPRVVAHADRDGLHFKLFGVHPAIPGRTLHTYVNLDWNNDGNPRGSCAFENSWYGRNWDINAVWMDSDSRLLFSSLCEPVESSWVDQYDRPWGFELVIHWDQFKGASPPADVVPWRVGVPGVGAALGELHMGGVLAATPWTSTVMIEKLNVTLRGDSIRFAFQRNDPGAFFGVWFDTDQNDNTGAPGIPYGGGPDYMAGAFLVPWPTIGRVTSEGPSWTWEPSGVVAAIENGPRVELSLALADLGSPAGLDWTLGVFRSDAESEIYSGSFNGPVGAGRRAFVAGGAKAGDAITARKGDGTGLR